jgi:Ca-activated chloride channel family protein
MTFSITVALSTGIPLRDVSSPSHTIGLSWKDKSMADVSLARTGDFAGNRDFILKYRLAGKEIQSGLMLFEGEKENFFLLMVQPPERVKTANILPREYVFILDVSGSMDGFPLNTAKTLIKDLIGNLRKSDTFNLVLFAGSSSVMAPSSLPATRENIDRALKVIDRQSGGGGTELVPALKNALSIPRAAGTARSVIIITDGYIDAEREVFSLISNNLDKTNVFSFGIGSSVNRYLIEGMAKAGQGEPFVVTKPEQAATAASRFRDYVQSPLLTDCRVSFKGFEIYDVEPPTIPDLFAKRPLILFGKYRGKPSGEIEISGRSPDGAYRRVFRVEDTKPLQQHAPLKYLWARSRIARLSDFNASGENQETKKEVTALGLEYSLLTPYTSFIAVLDVVRNPDAKAADVDQPLPLPEGVSNNAVGMSSVPEPGLTVLAMAMAAAIVFIGLRRRRLELIRK